MQSFQELTYGVDFDYVEGSPHLKHQYLYRRLVKELRLVMQDVQARGLPTCMLDVGAGDGAFVEPALSAGWQVTGSEMSRASLELLKSKYGGNPKFDAVFDDGSFSGLEDSKFSLIVFASVLHHIPDYLGALQGATANYLADGGSIFTVQDPIWYERQSRFTRFASELSYASWRIGRGDVAMGIRNRLRRLRGELDESNPADMVEYHVVRNGVNETEILEFARSRFEQVRLVPYWSTQSSFWQGIGEKTGLSNTFAVIASGYAGKEDTTSPPPVGTATSEQGPQG